jgi:hypothetical protein
MTRLPGRVATRGIGAAAVATMPESSGMPASAMVANDMVANDMAPSSGRIAHRATVIAGTIEPMANASTGASATRLPIRIHPLPSSLPSKLSLRPTQRSAAEWPARLTGNVSIAGFGTHAWYAPATLQPALLAAAMSASTARESMPPAAWCEPAM